MVAHEWIIIKKGLKSLTWEKSLRISLTSSLVPFQYKYDPLKGKMIRINVTECKMERKIPIVTEYISRHVQDCCYQY